MQIIKNQNILQKQSQNYIKSELSNVAMVLQTPQLLTDYFSIDADASVLVPGFKNVEDYIHPNSAVVYNEVENLPMSGIDNLVTQAQYDDDVGFDEDLQSQGIIFPNTVVAKPGDCFFIQDSPIPALYVVTNVSPVTVRSNPFVEISIRLFSRDPEVFKQLRKQVKEHYITTVTAIGMDKSLVIKKESYFTVQEHIQNYLDIADMYKTLFYNPNLAAFIFDGLYDETEDRKLTFLDTTLWRLMFDEGIILFDDIITYANNNLNKRIAPIYSSCPDIYVDDHPYKRSILYRIYTQDHKHKLDEYKYPQAYEPDPRVGKFSGKNLIYFEQYGDTCDCNLMCTTCPTWDQEFIDRMVNGDCYNEYPLDSAYCTGCNNYCDGKPVTPYNPYLRNAIINWYNKKPIDWANLQLEDKKTCENYFLIPLLLGAYKSYIKNLQK